MTNVKGAATVLLAVVCVQISFGQVAIIQDPDGWTNVRKSPDAKSEIIHVLLENEVFWFDNESTYNGQDWISVYIPKNDFSFAKSEPNFITGFIHKSRLLPLEKLDVYTGKDFTFEYKLGKFDLKNRVVDKQDGKWVTAIDGRPVWGRDGDFPKIQVDGIEVKIEGHEIKIHEVFYADIFECRNVFSFFKTGGTYFVHQWNSDGAGAYEIVWVLDKNGLKQRLVGTMN